MKNKRTQKSFSKFQKRSDSARRDRDRARRELMRMVEETNVGTDSLVIKSAYDKGRAGASFKAPRVDEAIHTGVFSSSRQGYGFVTVEGLDRDVFIPDVAVHGAIDGDVVEITYRKYTNRFGEEKTEGRVKKILEMGVDGVIFPMVKTAEEVNRLIASTLYPPFGNRGFGPMNAVDYGFKNAFDYTKEDHKKLCRFVQIEHADMLDNIEEIAQIPYVDGFIFGPNDLSGSLGEFMNVFGDTTLSKIKSTN